MRCCRCGASDRESAVLDYEDGPECASARLCWERQKHEALTRALTAQAWAVAIALHTTAEHCVEHNTRELGWLWNKNANGIVLMEQALAALPAPADLAAQLLGDA